MVDVSVQERLRVGPVEGEDHLEDGRALGPRLACNPVKGIAPYDFVGRGNRSRGLLGVGWDAGESEGAKKCATSQNPRQTAWARPLHGAGT